jgi:23S rRNA (cytosine1962-C5)-methyltransferase
MLELSPQYWKDYELIDSGDFEKLERFGTYVLIRPEPQAIWDKSLSEREWEKAAHVCFVSRSSSSGTWKKFRDMPDSWKISYKNPDGLSIQFRLALTGFKHLGVFPEQAVNWDFIYSEVQKLKTPEPRFLNLFAYTGGASLAARCAGATTFHLDSIKQVVSWARENMELSGLRDIHWIVEDALSFVKREVKRGKKYQGIILDPPAYGHGPSGESWKLEDNLNEMMKNVARILDEEEHILILNAYSLGLSSLVAENLLSQVYTSKPPRFETGELFLPASHGGKLPLGTFGRSIKSSKK